jgi:hypothetical protein
MKPSENKKWTIAEILTNFGQRQAEVQQEKMLKQQLKDALMQNQAQALSQFIPGMQQQMPMNPDDMAFDEYYQQAKRGGIHIDPRKKGTFKAQATRMGMSVQEAASHILANKHRYSPAMVKKANFAKNFAKEEGGEMIKRADGSYSQRGLWDNIRANSGSGKKPTREMLAQERKIKRKVDGGITCDEGEEWNEELQACVKVVKESYGKDFLTDWYSKRGNIVNDPNFGGLEESPGYEKWLGKVLPMINNRIQNVPMSYEYLDVPGDNPDAKGVYLYDKKNPTIQIAKSVVANPLDFKTTLLHEYTTDSTADADKFVEPAHKFIVEKNIKSFEDFMDTSPDAEKLKKDEDLQEQLYEEYEYATGQTPEGKGNMHSYVMNWRDAFKMDPSKVYNEDDVAAMVEQAKSAGFFDRNSPAFNDDLYRLYRLAKDNKALANFFNLMANNNAPQKQSRLNDDIQYAKYGGDFGYMPNFF